VIRAVRSAKTKGTGPGSSLNPRADSRTDSRKNGKKRERGAAGAAAAAAAASGRRTGSIIPKVQRAAHRGTRGVSRGLAGRCDRRSSIPRAAESTARFRWLWLLSSIVSIFIPVCAIALAHSVCHHPSLIGLARAHASAPD